MGFCFCVDTNTVASSFVCTIIMQSNWLILINATFFGIRHKIKNTDYNFVKMGTSRTAKLISDKGCFLQ